MLYKAERRSRFSYHISHVKNDEYYLEVSWPRRPEQRRRRILHLSHITYQTAIEIVERLDHTGYPF